MRWNDSARRWSGKLSDVSSLPVQPEAAFCLHVVSSFFETRAMLDSYLQTNQMVTCGRNPESSLSDESAPRLPSEGSSSVDRQGVGAEEEP